MSRPHVVVVGGGIAGVTAALACADGGASVTLVEARGRLGGATRSARREGLWIDNGQHVFLRACTAYRSFLARIGSEKLVELQPRLAVPVIGAGGRMAWLRRGRLPAPFQLGPSLARYSHLGVLDRFRVGAGALRLARVDPSRGDLDDETFGRWLTRHGQSSTAVERFWNLITLPTLNVPAAQASLALAARTFRTGFFTDATAADIGYARVPLDRVHAEPATLALADAGVEVHLHRRVRHLEVGATGVDGVVVGGSRLSADAVVLAVPHNEAATLLPPGAAVDPVGLTRLGGSPIVNLHVVYSRAVSPLPFAAGVGTPVQFVFDRTTASGMGSSDGRQYLAVSLSGADEYISMSTGKLRSLFAAELARLFPLARTARIERFFVTREPAATFRAVPGTAWLRPGTRTGVPHLYLSGAWTDTGWPATMEGAARSGERAAAAALADVGLGDAVAVDNPDPIRRQRSEVVPA